MNYFIDALKRYADFTGRARRKEYWMFVLFYLIFYIAAVVVDLVLGTYFLALIFALAMIIPSIAIAARRLHDTGRSGWWQLIALVPFVGFIILLVFLVMDSTADNAYGPNPKQPSAIA